MNSYFISEGQTLNSNEELYRHLASQGPKEELEPFIDSYQLSIAAEAFDNSWVHYNPRKKIDRWGLSLTSLDGGMSGYPDLDSIKEYNIENNTSLDEPDFNVRTKASYELEPLVHIFDSFSEHLGRCHLIKFNQGGYFPPHRDSQDYNPRTFRLLALLDRTAPSSFVVHQQGERCWLREGKLYFFDTRLSHSFFSFIDGATILVMNITISPTSVELVKSLFKSK
jgi:hypothetical protein